MSKLRVVIVAGVIWIFYPISAQGLTLSEFLSQVKDANPSVRSSKLRAKALEHRVDPAGTLDDPFIAGGVDQIPTDGSMGSVQRYQISQSIPFPGKLGARSDIAENRAKSAQSDAETINREITVLATQIFYRAYYNQKAIELNEKQKKLIEGTVESTKARYKTGDTGGHHDWLLAKVELSIIDVEKLRLRREQKTLTAVLNELRDKAPDSSVGNFVVQFSNDDIKENEIPAPQDQPELKSLGYLLTQAEKEQRLAKLSYFPDFTIQGMMMRPSPDMMNEKENWGVMVGINIPLYFWRKQSELVTATSIDREAVILEKRNIENRINTEMVDAKQELQTARDIVELYKSSIVPTTTLAAQNARSGYASRRLPLTQFLEIMRVQRTQELEFLAAQIDVELSRTRIKEILSSPPLLRLAPSKPSLFGGGAMGGSSMGSDTVNMGRGMSGPTRKTKSSEPSQSGGSGMGNM